jgi:tetratricopeptide (TPR) repeat protein
MRANLLQILLFLFLFNSACHFKENDKPEQINHETKKEGLQLLNEQIVAQPKNAALYYDRSKLFLEKNDVRQAYEDISKAVALDSTKVDYYLLLADVSFKGLQIQRSIDAFKKAISLDPKNKNAHLKLSELYLYLKAYPQCLAEANEALTIDKNIAKAYFIKGFAYKETADTSKALSSFQTAVEIQSDYYDAYIQLGNIESARKHKIALQYYNNALRVQPGSTEALYNRGLLLQNMGEIEKAIDDYNAIIKIDDKYADAYYNLGYIDLAYKKNYPSAIGHFTDAIRVNDQYAEAFYNRGVAYDLSGDRKSAEKDYRQALVIVPTFKLAKERLREKKRI